MHKQRLGMLIAAAVGMLGTFLPWATVMFISVSGTAGDGWITFALFAIALVMTLLGNKQEILDGTKFFVAVICGIVAAAFAIWKIIDIGAETGGAMAGAVSIGFGLYLIVVAGFALAIVGFILKKK